MSQYDNAGVRAFLRFAGEFSDDPRCVELKRILQKRPQPEESTAEKLLNACRSAVVAFNEQEFIVMDVNGPQVQGKSLGMSKEGQEKLASHAQLYLLHALTR